ncbi:MAG: hypothetical protein AAFX57_20950, partial [Bacteroidota bacterium]
SSFSSWTPYQFAYNDPIAFNDPTGLQNEYGLMGDLYGRGAEREMGPSQIGRKSEYGSGWYGPGYEELQWNKLVNNILQNGTAILDNYNGYNYVVGNEHTRYYWSDTDFAGLSFTREEDQTSGGINAVDLGKTNSGELLLYNLRKIYSDYQSNGSADRERYELSDAVNILTKFSGASDRGGMGSQSSGTRTIAGVDVRITVIQFQDNDGNYLTSGENRFD